MKRFILFAFMLFFSVLFGQNLQNNNWIFGDSSLSGIRFDSPITQFAFPSLSPNTINPDFLEGCASLSDDSGNLILFSDGKRLWGRDWGTNNFVLITEQLKGSKYSTQNVIFIPKPKNPNKYYVVTINGNPSDSNNGLYFSEVDVTNNNVIFLNKPLRFYRPSTEPNLFPSVVVDQSFRNNSEAITSTILSTKGEEELKDYWLVAHVSQIFSGEKKGYLLSFKVTCDGIGNNFNIADFAVERDIDTEGVGLTLKISNMIPDKPNTSRIAFSATAHDIWYGLFSNENGEIEINENDRLNAKPYGLEFSPDTKILYYSGLNSINSFNFITSQDVIYSTNSFGSKIGLQIGRDQKIYATNNQLDAAGNIDIHQGLQVINDPNNSLNPDIQTLEIFTNIGLPQWVHKHVVKPTEIKADDVYLEFDGCITSTLNSTIPIENYNLTIVGGVTPQPTSGGIIINVSNGQVTVLEGTPEGIYTALFQLCEKIKCPICSNIATLTIKVTNKKNIVPLFNIPNPICILDIPFTLPTTSSNGIVGTWNPSVVTSTSTPPYVFIPDPGQCATSITLNITIDNNTITPTFSPVASICAGVFLAPLPTLSNNGIHGSWSPALNNQTTTTYTFTPHSGQCAIQTTLTIVVKPNETPTFNQIGPICAGDTLAPLPTQSNNGIHGTWSPALNNQTTTTYTFTPNNGICAVPVQLTIVVNQPVIPTFNLPTILCVNETPPILPVISSNFISGNWVNNSIDTSQPGTFSFTFTPNPGQCADQTTITIVVKPNVITIFNNLVDFVCYDSIAPELPTISDNLITGYWVPPVVSTTQSGTYTFYPHNGQCASQFVWNIDVSNEYDLVIMDQYIDGILSGNNTVGLAVNGNYPIGTNYLWTLTYQDGSVLTYSSTTIVTMVFASATNRIDSASVVATYQGCSKEYFDTWHCSVPHSDENGIIFCDCTGACPRISSAQPLSDTIKLYPNPTNSLIYFEGDNLTNYQITIYDSLGKTIIKDQPINKELDLENYPSGFYIYQINNNHTVIQHGKIVKN